MEKAFIERLVARYFDATATEAEERLLRDLLLRTEPLPAEWQELRTLFRGLESLAGERLPERAPDWLSGAASGSPCVSAGVFAKIRRPLLRWAAVAALVAAGLFAGRAFRPDPYCYIDGVAVYDPETALETTACLEHLSRLETSVRLADELLQNL